MKASIKLKIENIEEFAVIMKALGSINLEDSKEIEVNPVVVEKQTKVSDTNTTKVVIETPKVQEDCSVRKLLEKEAKELGITFRSDIGDKPLELKIKDFKSKKVKPPKLSDAEVRDLVNTQLEADTDADEEFRKKVKEEVKEKKEEEVKVKEEIKPSLKEELNNSSKKPVKKKAILNGRGGVKPKWN